MQMIQIFGIGEVRHVEDGILTPNSNGKLKETISILLILFGYIRKAFRRIYHRKLGFFRTWEKDKLQEEFLKRR